MLLIPWSHKASEGFTIRGRRSPKRGKPLLHFIHGNGYSSLTYRPMLEPLSKEFDLWLCDIQGHGESDHGGKFRGWNRNAELAAEAFAEGKKDYGDVASYGLGHSFGAVLTGLILASTPSLFSRAVLLDPPLLPPVALGKMALATAFGLNGNSQLAKQAKRRRRSWPDRESAYASLQGRGMFQGWQEDALHAYVEHALRDYDGGVELKCHPSREAEIFSSFPRRLWPSLREINVPTEVLYGQQTDAFVEKSAIRLSRRNPAISLRAVPGGHCFMQEQPTESASYISKFLLHGSR